MSSLRGQSNIWSQIARGRGKICPRLLAALQREVVRMLADGKTTKEAASILGVTRRTVAKYREDMRIPSTHQRRVKT